MTNGIKKKIKELNNIKYKDNMKYTAQQMHEHARKQRENCAEIYEMPPDVSTPMSYHILNAPEPELPEGEDETHFDIFDMKEMEYEFFKQHQVLTQYPLSTRGVFKWLNENMDRFLKLTPPKK